MTTNENVFRKLDDRPLFDAAKRLATEERRATAALLRALMEIDGRRLYLGEGCASMFAYCTQVLHLAEGAAYNRIEAARAARDYPLIPELFEQSAITLTAVRLLAPHLTAENHLAMLAAARHKSKREIEERCRVESETRRASGRAEGPCGQNHDGSAVVGGVERAASLVRCMAGTFVITRPQVWSSKECNPNVVRRPVLDVHGLHMTRGCQRASRAYQALPGAGPDALISSCWLVRICAAERNGHDLFSEGSGATMEERWPSVGGRMTQTVIRISMMSWLLAAASAHAQGFGIYEHGACVMARGAAGVAAPCDDGSAIYVNPAGIVGREGVTLGSGGMLVFGSGRFTSDAGKRTSLDSGISLVPHGYFVYGVNPRLAFGVGVYAPYGLGVKWPLDFDGRFLSYDSTLKTIYVQPTAAYALNDRVSIGGGLTFALSSVELNRREDLATIPLGTSGLSFSALVDNQTDFAQTTLSASGATGLGVNLGGLIKAHERVRLGARYLSRVTLSYDGDATFTAIPGNYQVTKPNPLGLPVGTPIDTLVAQVLTSLPNQHASTELVMPAQFVVGASVQAADRLTILVDYQWVGWSVFDTVTLDFENPSTPDERLVQGYRDTSAVRLGGEFKMTPSLRLRTGYAYTQAAAPDETVTPLLPEAQRNHLTAGVGWNPKRNMTVDLAYQFIAHADRRGRTVNPLSGERPTVGLNSGLYRSRGDLLSLTITFRP